jgi:hypothetical protein
LTVDCQDAIAWQKPEAQPSSAVALPDELVLGVVVPALDPESLPDPPQPEDAATSKRVIAPHPKIRTPRALVMRAISASEAHRGIAPMG